MPCSFLCSFVGWETLNPPLGCMGMSVSVFTARRALAVPPCCSVALWVHSLLDLWLPSLLPQHPWGLFSSGGLSDPNTWVCTGRWHLALSAAQLGELALGVCGCGVRDGLWGTGGS